MDLPRLQARLRGRPDRASRDCADAIGHGAHPEVLPGRASTSVLVTIYRRRAAHVAAVGIDHAGFDSAVADLAASGEETVRLAQVVGDDARHHLLFLAPDSDDVVACLWVRDPV